MASVVGQHLEQGDKSKKGKGHLTRHITGGFLTFLFCALTAELAPELGALLAIAVASNAFFKYGLPTINSRFEKGKKGEGEKAKYGERIPGTPLGPSRTPEPLPENVSPLANVAINEAASPIFL